MFIAFVFGLLILPPLGWGWFDYLVTRQGEHSRSNILLIALCVSSFSAVGFIGTTLALTRYGNSMEAFYFRLAAVGALLSCIGILAGVFAKPVPKKFLFAGVGILMLLFWLFLAIVVLPVS